MKKNGGRRHMARHAEKSSGILPVVLAAACITVIALGMLFGPDIIHAIRGTNTQKSLQDLYRGRSSSLMEYLFPMASAEETERDQAEASVTVHDDFIDLYEANEHLVGWLTLGERIDYPVVQFDNSYYLEHDYFGNKDDAGTLFINKANELNPRDSILLVHGHNMRVGTMFGDLDFFREYPYLCKYPIVSFRMIEDPEDVWYVPVAGFDASMNPEAQGYFDIKRVRFEFDVQPETPDGEPGSTELEQYLEEARRASYWTSPVEADSTDEYILLVTCSYLHDDGRMLLLCRKLREGETPELIYEWFQE